MSEIIILKIEAKRKFAIEINQEIVDLYHKDYFEKYPRRKVEPIKRVTPPTLNGFVATKRMTQNSVKQKYKEFAMWMVSYYNLTNLNLDKAHMRYTFTFGDRRRRDMDNMILRPKFFNDGFVEAGVIEDDDGTRLEISFGSFQYEKWKPKVLIEIFEL